MNTRHVPDLELCQELDRLCKEKKIVVPETEFWWWKVSGGEWGIISDDKKRAYQVLRWVQFFIPAPLVSEQGKWLPQMCSTHKGGQHYTCSLGAQWTGLKKSLVEFAVTEANARQKMLNYLIAERIITKL